MPILPEEPRKYPNDINLLSFIFQAARSDLTLRMLLTQIQFIRDRPNLTEAQIRRELAKPKYTGVVKKAPEKLSKT